MLEKRGRASDQENEKYRNPDKCTAVILRNDLLVHLHGVSPRSHTTYHIPSLKVKDGKFQVIRLSRLYFDVASCPLSVVVNSQLSTGFGDEVS